MSGRGTSTSTSPTLDSLQLEIQKVEDDISNVEKEIKENSSLIETCTNQEEKLMLMRDREKLRTKEELLRTKENQLREEKLSLIKRKEEKIREETKQNDNLNVFSHTNIPDFIEELINDLPLEEDINEEVNSHSSSSHKKPRLDSNSSSSSSDPYSLPDISVRLRPSLTRHNDLFSSSTRLESNHFGSYLKFVNRHEQCNTLVKEIQVNWNNYCANKRKKSFDYSKHINILCSGGAPGIGKTTWARLALDHYDESKVEVEFKKVLDICKSEGRRYCISYGDDHHCIRSELDYPSLSIAARFLWEHIKYTITRRCKVKSYQTMWDYIMNKRKKFTCIDVCAYICGNKAPESMIIINLDEINVLFKKGEKVTPSHPNAVYISECLSSLLSLQKRSEAFVVPILTATQALNLHQIAVISGSLYKDIQLPLLDQPYVEEVVKDLYLRAKKAIEETVSSTSNELDNVIIPPRLTHLLKLMCGNPRFLECCLFHLGMCSDSNWTPKKFIENWNYLSSGKNGTGDPSDLIETIKSAIEDRYKHFQNYIGEPSFKEITPELLFHTLFKEKVDRNQIYGKHSIKELEENGVIFLTPSTLKDEFIVVIPYLWLHAMHKKCKSSTSSTPHLSLLWKMIFQLSSTGYEELVISVITLRCYFYSKYEWATPITAEKLFNVKSLNGKEIHLFKLPEKVEQVYWRPIVLKSQIKKDNWQSFFNNPREYIELINQNSLQTYFYLNGRCAPFWDGAILLPQSTPIFIQTKRSLISEEKEAQGKSVEKFSFDEFNKEINKCKFDDKNKIIDQVYFFCTESILSIEEKEKLLSDYKNVYVVDRTNQDKFFGLLLHHKELCSSDSSPDVRISPLTG